MTTRSEPTNDETEETEPDTDHLEDIEDGCGCAEVWEHLSERREAEADDD